MQVICNREKECTIKGCDGHHPHSNCPQKPCARAGGISGAVCIPIQSDFERGQGKHYEQHSWWWAGILIYGGNDDPAYRGNVWCSVINPDELPKGICRNCGKEMSEHYPYFAEDLREIPCRSFLLTEPLAPAKKDVSFVDVLTYDAGYEAGKADCAKTHEALRNEGRKSGYKQGVEESCIDYEEAKKDGRKEVVEWVEGNVRLLCTRADWQNKKEEWGL